MIHEESMRDVEVFIGSMYRSGDMTTGGKVRVGKFRGNVSEDRVTMIDVFPTPSTKLSINRYHLREKVL